MRIGLIAMLAALAGCESQDSFRPDAGASGPDGGTSANVVDVECELATRVTTYEDGRVVTRETWFGLVDLGGIDTPFRAIHCDRENFGPPSEEYCPPTATCESTGATVPDASELCYVANGTGALVDGRHLYLTCGMRTTDERPGEPVEVTGWRYQTVRVHLLD